MGYALRKRAVAAVILLILVAQLASALQTVNATASYSPHRIPPTVKKASSTAPTLQPTTNPVPPAHTVKTTKTLQPSIAPAINQPQVNAANVNPTGTSVPTGTVQITLTSTPYTDSNLGTGGIFISVDNSAEILPVALTWTSGTNHTLSINIVDQATRSIPCPGVAGCRFVFQHWKSNNIGQPVSTSLTYPVPNAPETVTAWFEEQYQLTMQVTVSGIINPAGGTTSPDAGPTGSLTQWWPACTQLQLGETPKNGYRFIRWTGTGTGSYSGNQTTPAPLITLTNPMTEAASFVPTIGITVTSIPPGWGYVTVDGSGITTPTIYTNWIQGSTHTLSANSPVGCGTGCQWVFKNWTSALYGVLAAAPPNSVNCGTWCTISYTLSATSDTVTAIFQKNYQLNMIASPPSGGTTLPSASNVGACVGTIKGCYWYTAGASVPILATAAQGFSFAGWTAVGAGSHSGFPSSSTIVMNAPINETANFASGGGQVSIVVTSSPTSQSTQLEFVTVNGTGIMTPQDYVWVSGHVETLAATQSVSCGAQCAYIFQYWSSPSAGVNRASTLLYTVPATNETVTAYYLQQSGNNVQITVTSNPPGQYFVSVDHGATITTPTTYTWVQGSTHTLTATQTVGCGNGCAYAFLVWSSPSTGTLPSGDWNVTYTVPSNPETVTAVFQKQYQLTMQASPANSGTTTPPLGTTWENASAQVDISQNPASSLAFTTWSGVGLGSYTGMDPAPTITMNGPITETANYAQANFDFIVFASPGEQTVTPGQTATFTVTVLLLYGTPQDVSLSVLEAAPSGMTITFNPASGLPTYTSTLEFATTPAVTQIGDYPFTIVGTSSTFTRTAMIVVHVVNTVAGDFVIHLNPTAGNTTPGGPQVNVAVNVVPINSYTQTVGLTLANASAGITMQFAPQSGQPQFASSAVIGVAASVAPSTYVLKVVGTGADGKVRTSPFLLLVTTPNGEDFTINAIPTELAVPIPKSGTNTKALFTVVTPLRWVSSPATVTLSVTGMPTGTTSPPPTFQFTSVSVPPIATSRITLYVQSTATPSETVVTVQGVSVCGGSSCTRDGDFLLILYVPTSTVLVNIMNPQNDPTGVHPLNGTVQILANITDVLLGPGPQNIVRATYQITGSGYDSGTRLMVCNGIWTWQQFWNSFEATATTGGPYTLTVVGINKNGDTGSDSITVYVDNTGSRPLSTYYVNLITNPNAGKTYDATAWSPEFRFLPGETIGVRFSAPGGSPTGTLQVFNSTNTDVTGAVITPGIEPNVWVCTDPSGSYICASLSLKGLQVDQPAAGLYYLHVPYKDQSGNTVDTGGYPFKIVRLDASWTVVNGFDHADVIAALTLGGEAPLLHRDRTISGHAIIGPSGGAVTGYVDDTGIVDITVPYYAWENLGVTFQLTYATSNSPLYTTNPATGADVPAQSQPFPYIGLGISYSTTGMDFAENVSIATFQKRDPGHVVATWVAVQVPETGQWTSSSLTLPSASAFFTIDVSPPQHKFSVQVWAYALDSSIIYANQYSNLNIVTEQSTAAVSHVTATLSGSQAHVTGELTLDTSTMSLSNVQVSVTLTDQNGHQAAASSYVQTLNPGTNPISTNLTGAVAPGTYTVTVTVQSLSTGWTLSTTTTTVTV